MSADARPVLLVIEDDLGLQRQMRWSFDRYEIVFADDYDTALTQLRRYEPRVATLDLGLPPHKDRPDEGFRTLSAMLAIQPALKVIALTGQDDHANAVKSIGMGAIDFFSKPFEPERLGVMLERAFHVADLERHHRRAVDAPASEPLPGLLTVDPTMLKRAKQIERLAPLNLSVLLLGESGTGKELFANALHELSNRRSKKFVAINCAAIPENLLESELFGYERGAFTGAARQTIGKIESANGGTLFLDEIGDMPTALQPKLLRFLQERVVERIGSREGIRVQVRVVCATHRSLQNMMSAGEFREDLFYRLSEISLDLPPLRDRVGDAVALAHAFVRRLAKQSGRERPHLADDALAAIEAYQWPGNVRELENCIKRAVVLAEGRLLRAADLGLAPVGATESLNLRHRREALDKETVITALARAEGNIARASDLLGISRPTMYDLLNRLGLREDKTGQAKDD